MESPFFIQISAIVLTNVEILDFRLLNALQEKN
nr:MAG TPA: hypothetical protein [Caudoviricetes sp.]